MTPSSALMQTNSSEISKKYNNSRYNATRLALGNTQQLNDQQETQQPQNQKVTFGNSC